MKYIQILQKSGKKIGQTDHRYDFIQKSFVTEDA